MQIKEKFLVIKLNGKTTKVTRIEDEHEKVSVSLDMKDAVLEEDLRQQFPDATDEQIKTNLEKIQSQTIDDENEAQNLVGTFGRYTIEIVEKKLKF